MYQKVLVPIDGSEESLKAAKLAYDFVEGGTKEVNFLLVISYPLLEYDLVLSRADQEALSDNFKKLEQSIRDRLKEVIGTTQFNLTVLYGNVVETISSLATNDNYDLIIMGHRGLGKLKRLILGSVSSSVANLAHCSVLIVK